MNKKVILSWLSLVTLIATGAYAPMTAASLSTSTSSAASSGSRENVIKLIPEVRRVGFVVAYSPGQSITIVDRQGNEFTFELDSPLKIVPAHRANLLGPGAFVTIIAPNNVPNGKHIAVGIVIHRGVPPGFAGPGGPPTPGTPLVFPAPVAPFIPLLDKPSLAFSPLALPTLPPLQTILGYTFPGDFTDWTIAIRVAAFQDITIALEGFTPVGIAELGLPNIVESGLDHDIYLVTIDLISTEETVEGTLVGLTTDNTFDVTFQRIPQILNPERTDSPYEEFQELSPAPASASTIFAGGACFVVTLADGPTKYCSNPSGPDEPASPLSVSDNFPSQYASLQDLISEVAGQFDLQNLIQMDQIVSMQEDVQHIQDCASELTQQACGADIVGAPVMEQYFEQKFEQKFGEGTDEEDNGDDGSNSLPAPFDVAVLKVLRPIETSNGTIQPGDYRMDYWFDSNGVFYAATLTGVTTDDIQVINQQIPAVPATLINANENDPQQPASEISAWRCNFLRGSWCVWFEHC